MIKFDSIHIEVRINNTWVDLSPDVQASPSPRVSGMGIMGQAPLDRVGGTATFSFALNNSASNSAALIGYYTPGHPNALPGWTTGLPVRLYFVYDGIYSYKFYGKITPDGIVVNPGVRGKRTVNVDCSNWMREAENRTVDLIAYQTNQTADSGIQHVIDNMPTAPLSTSFQEGTRTFPTIFDTTSKKTKAASEINKLTVSEFGLCYMRGTHSTSLTDTGGEELVFENRTYRYGQRETVSRIPLFSQDNNGFVLLETGDVLLLETGDKVLLEASEDAIFSDSDLLDMRSSYGAQIVNRVKLVSYPRLVDASNVILWTLETPVSIPAFGIVSGIRGGYRDPNGKASSVSGIEMVAPVSGTDYIANSQEDGGGSNLTANLSVSVTYGTAEPEYTLINTGAILMYVTTLRARGKGVYIYDSASVVFESVPSILLYGINELTVDMPYLDDVSDLFTLSHNIDLALLEDGFYLLLENGDYIRHNDEEGVFDLLVSDEPQYNITHSTFSANRSTRDMLAFMTLDAGSFIKISEAMTNITNEFTYCISGYDLEVMAGGLVKWHPVLMSATQYPKI